MELNRGKALKDQKIFERGIARITVILGIVIVMTAGIAGACLYYFWYDARTPELSASVMVPETQIYASINLRPEKSELFKLQDIFERFKETKGFDEGYNDILDDFRNETGVDIEDDILPWLEELAIGITMDINNPEDISVVVLGGTSDSESSTSTIEKILDYARDNNDFKFEEAEYRGYDYIFNEDEEIYLAIAKEYVILCSSNDLLKDVIDLMAEGGESLADQPKFQNARAEMPSNRVGFFYMDTEAMFSEAFDEAMSDYEYDTEDQEQIDLLEQTMPEYMVASAQCIDYGLKIDYYTKYSEEIDHDLLLADNNELKSMKLIPADALGLISYSGISSLWEQQRSSMDEEMIQELDEIQNDIREEIGYDLDEILALIDGEIAITMLPGGMYISPDGEFDGMPRMVALVEIEDREEMDSFVEEMKEFILEEYEMGIGQIDISGQQAFIFSDSSGENEIAAYMYLDDFFIIGLTPDALAKIVETGNGISPSLAENNGMVRPLGMVKDANSVFYLNIQGIIDQVLELIPENVVDNYKQEYARYFEPFEACLFTGSGATNDAQLYTIGTFIVTVSASPPVEKLTSVDSDNDGWTDDLERSMKTNPYLADTDKDGIIDPEDPDPLPNYEPDTKYELMNIRLALTATMADAGSAELDASYLGVNTNEEVWNVTAGEGVYRLTDYLEVFDTLVGTYDISKNGSVVVSP